MVVLANRGGIGAIAKFQFSIPTSRVRCHVGQCQSEHLKLELRYRFVRPISVIKEVGHHPATSGLTAGAQNVRFSDRNLK